MFSHIKELFTRPSGYTISRSVRLRSSASAYLNRTPASATNQKTWTWSGWVKRGTLGVNNGLFQATPALSNQTSICLSSNNTLFLQDYSAASSYNLVWESSAVFRDPSAWYHFVVSYDTTQASSSNAVKLYVNNVQQTLTFTAYSGAYVQNRNGYINSNIAHSIGLYSQTDYFNGYLTEINFIDGQALTPSSFGETDSITGVWKAKKYSGTYGTNGFYLNFSDNSSNTATTIGKDYSGNGNNWTPNNISVTSGVTYDSMVDSPTVSAVSSNYAVWNPLQKTSTLSQANLLSAGGGSAIFYSVASTISIPSGKWYWEITCVSNTDGLTGIVETNQMIDVIRNGNYVGQTSLGYGYHANGNKYNNGASSAYGSSYTTGDVIGVAFDADNRTLTFYKNNVSQGTAFTVTSGYTWLPADSVYTSDSKAANFGQRPFTYTPPSGFVALNTQNLPDSTIKNGAGYMAATTYTGTGAARSVTGVGFQPDFVWVKQRNTAGDHAIYDSVRGGTKDLASSNTSAEVVYTDSVNTFDSGGFSIAGGFSKVNTSAGTYVAWQWKAGGTSSSNTNGSITSTVSVGATQGFSVVTYTGTGANATVGHGLGVAPSLLIVKQRNTVRDWPVWHSGFANTQYLSLNATDALQTAATQWNSTTPTSTVFSIGTSGGVNQSAGTYVAYCFSAVKGFSAFGSYTPNNSADGPFIYTGFRPRWLLIKGTGGASGWYMYDTARQTYNAMTADLRADLSNAEPVSSQPIDILSNGFKIRTTDTNFNNTTYGPYIYACFAENNFKNSLAR